MTKFVKMSLAAAVAVAGISSTASAKPLEEAIKGVDVSGYVRYRYTNGKANTETSAYKIVTQVKAPVNDMVTATVKFAGEGTITEATGDEDPDPTAVKYANFTFALPAATVIAGKQSLATPFAAGDDQQGTGVVALIPAGSVTIAGGWYTNSDSQSIYNVALGNSSGYTDVGSNNITALAAIGKAGPIDFAVWYAIVAEEGLVTGDVRSASAKAGATAYNVNLAGTFGPVSVELNHASVDYSLNSAAKAAVAGVDEMNPTQTRVIASMDLGSATVKAGYIMTGDEGGDVTLGDEDATANFYIENEDLGDWADAGFTYVAASTKVSNVTLGLDYVTGEGRISGNAAQLVDKEGKSSWQKYDVSELKISAAYAMSKNFKISAFSTVGEQKSQASGSTATESDMNRVEIKYTF